MSWNEVKITLAPVGSTVFESRDRPATGADGYPVTVLTVCPPARTAHASISAKDVHRWLIERGFEAFIKRADSTRFRLNDIEILVGHEADSTGEVLLNFRVELDARERFGIWKQFVREMCERHRLQLVDPKVGLVDPEAFETLETRSFAWKCFLESERSRHK